MVVASLTVDSSRVVGPPPIQTSGLGADEGSNILSMAPNQEEHEAVERLR